MVSNHLIEARPCYNHIFVYPTFQLPRVAEREDLEVGPVPPIKANGSRQSEIETCDCME